MGVVNTQYTFAANDVITSTKMNDIIDQTTVDGSAILGNTLEVAGGKLKVRAQGITSNELAANAVTNTQITNGSVTPAKLSTGSPNWDTSGNLNVNSGLYVAGGATIVGGVGVGGNLGVSGHIDCGAVYFGDDAGLLYDSGVGSVTIRYGVTGSEKYSTFESNGQLTVGGEIVSTTGTIRAQGYGGTATAGVVYFGNGDNYVYHNGSSFEFKFGAGVSATLTSAGTIWTSGNDGSGSGLDADLLDGLQPAELNVANTIVKRNANGDFNAGTVQLHSLSVTSLIGGTTSGNIKQSGGANQLNNVVYMGWRADATLGVQVDSTSFENNWPINITGSAAAATNANYANSAGSATTVSNGAITAEKLNGAQTGAAPIYGVRAFVNFNGVGTVGANMTIRSAGNVGSVNKTAVGVYRINFAVAMPNANYAAIVGDDANSAHKMGGVITQTAEYVDIAYSQINTSTSRDNPTWGQVTIVG